MWPAREKELELEDKVKNISKDRHESKSVKCHSDSRKRSLKSRSERKHKDSSNSCSSSKLDDESYLDEDGSLKDEEIEEFLQSRAKRGRGAIGTRMDEAGPYLSSSLHRSADLLPNPDVRVKEDWEDWVLGSEKPDFMKYEPLDSIAMRSLQLMMDLLQRGIALRTGVRRRRVQEKPKRKIKGPSIITEAGKGRDNFNSMIFLCC